MGSRAVESACRACRGVTVRVKLERTDISTALYAAALESEGAACGAKRFEMSPASADGGPGGYDSDDPLSRIVEAENPCRRAELSIFSAPTLGPKVEAAAGIVRLFAHQCAV